MSTILLILVLVVANKEDYTVSWVRPVLIEAGKITRCDK